MQRTKEQAAVQGFVENPSGRRLYLPNIRNKNANANARAGAERAAINAPHTRHCIRPHQTRHDRRVPLAFRRPEKQIDYAVHDELVLEAPEVKLDLVKEKLPQMMAKVDEGILKVPLIAEVGAGMNWGKAH